ncbi:MAG: putative DNA-binding domain-containing protein [Proteobacteria bacterium]|nr:putative DNA-binding domain-containing protein [Pseudomonadota bacterium]
MTNIGMGRFQADFAGAVFEQAPPGSAPCFAQPAFAVYRNTVMKGCIDALEANYPCVARLVGSDWFRSVAARFVAANPPQDSSLFDYGESFADFLAGVESAAELDYLPGVARLDRFWSESHVAADAPVLDAAQLARLAPQDLTNCCLKPHPAARWSWFETQPIYSIWERNRSNAQPQHDLLWQPEGALLTRPHSSVLWHPVGRADCAFLDACAAGLSLVEAVEQAQIADPQADLMATVGRVLSAGAIQALSTSDTKDSP